MYNSGKLWKKPTNAKKHTVGILLKTVGQFHKNV